MFLEKFPYRVKFYTKVKAEFNLVSIKKFSVFPLDLGNKRGLISTFLQNMCHLQPFCQLLKGLIAISRSAIPVADHYRMA